MLGGSGREVEVGLVVQLLGPRALLVEPHSKVGRKGDKVMRSGWGAYQRPHVKQEV